MKRTALRPLTEDEVNDLRKILAASKTRTVAAPKKSQPDFVACSAWLGRMAERIERHADDIDPDENPPRRTSAERAKDLRAIAKALRERSNAA